MVKIRLRRMGTKKRPFFRVVVADSRSPRDGRFIENIGKYHPMNDPSVIEIDEERAMHWLGQGAQPSDPVRVLLEKVGIWEKFRPGETRRVREPKPPKPRAEEELPVHEPPMQEAPVQEESMEEAPVEEAPVEEAPVEEAPVEEAPVEESSTPPPVAEESPSEPSPAPSEESEKETT
jgi:small subunit ribosomal protein S16